MIAIPIIPILTKAGVLKKAGEFIVGKLTGDKKDRPEGKAGATDQGLTVAGVGLAAAVGVTGLPETIEAVKQLVAMGREAWPLLLVVIGFIRATFGIGRKAGVAAVER